MGRRELDMTGWLNTTDTTITFGQCGGKESSCQCRRLKGTGLNPRARKSPWRKWQPTPVLLPGESRGQGSLVHYSPWGHKEPDKTKRLSAHECVPAHKHTHTHTPNRASKHMKQKLTEKQTIQQQELMSHFQKWTEQLDRRSTRK